LAYPNDRTAAAYPHQFLCGDSLLVIPILCAAGTVEGYLPENEGGWYDLFTGTHYDDGEVISADFDLERIPVFVKASHALALGPIVQSTAETNYKPQVSQMVQFGRGPYHCAVASNVQMSKAAVKTWRFE
jgi:alpha-D-xyloside xylohydrolase